MNIDEKYGLDNPVGGCYLTKPKYTRILAGSWPTALRDIIGKQVVAELLNHDLRFTGLAGADLT